MCVPRKESKFPAKSVPLSLSGEAQVADMWRAETLPTEQLTMP